MKHLKNFESILNESPNEQWKHLEEIYLYLCDLLQDLKDDDIKITIHTNKYLWGELDRKKVNQFIIFCQQFTKFGHYYLKIDFENNNLLGDYKSKTEKLPEFIISDLDSVVKYLESEGFNVKLEAQIPNSKLKLDADRVIHVNIDDIKQLDTKLNQSGLLFTGNNNPKILALFINFAIQ